MPNTIKRACVFCGSRNGRRSEYVAAARTTGALLAQRNITVVYGGGGKGLMGAVADGALEAGGDVIGVIPSFMTEQEQAHPGVTDMRIVGGMAERKEVMMTLSDAFVVLPGGVGTLDELFEVVSLRLLHLHAKPTAILDVEGYFKPLRDLAERAQQEQFISDKWTEALIYDDDPVRLLDRLASL